MLSDNVSVAILEDFVRKVRLAVKSNQKEIKLSIGDAESLVHNLNIITLRLLDKMQNAEIEKNTREEIITVKMDGGSL